MKAGAKMKGELSQTGALPPNPRDLAHLDQSGCWKGKGKAAPKDGHPSWSPPRRSGRVPALPYPPGGYEDTAMVGTRWQASGFDRVNTCS